MFLKTWTFGPFVLDAQRNVLSADGSDLRIGARVVATLAALIERRGEVVSKAELLDRIWPNEDVGESSVTQAVYVLRKTLRGHGIEDAIVTVPWRGYRFDGTVRERREPPMSPSPEALNASDSSVPPVPVTRDGRVREVHHESVLRERPATGIRSAWISIAIAAAAAICIAVIPSAAKPFHNDRGRHAAAVARPLSVRGATLLTLGRYHWNLRTPADLAAATRLFAQVVRSDPRNPAGYVGLADTDLMIADYEYGTVDRRAVFAHARREIDSALALDPNFAGAHVSRAMLLYAADHRADAADREFVRALQLDPKYAIAHHWYGTTLVERGRYAEGTRELRAALELDPTSPATSAWLGATAYEQRHFSDAILYERIAFDLRPSEFGELRTLGLAYELSGDLRSAARTFERLDRLTRANHALSAHWNAGGLLAEVYARGGQRNAARDALRRALREAPRDPDTALALAALGQRARAIGIIAAFPRADGMTLANDPRIDPLRADLPRWMKPAPITIL